MARQRTHNRRAGRGNTGSSWISYSDIMAALLLVFVLFLVYNLYQYNQTLLIKTQELDTQKALVSSQQAQLEEQAGILIIQQSNLDAASAELGQIRLELSEKESELEQQNIILIGKMDELDQANATLAARETELNQLQLALGAQKELFDAQTQRLEEMVGVRSEIVRELSSVLSRSHLAAQVDPNTGDIMLDSKVFFQTNSSEIREDGKALLDAFVPVYLDVLLQPQYRDYVGEIVIEGHTDSSGSFIRNLQLSQDRALAVATYILTMPGLSENQQALLRTILTAKGRSYNDLVYLDDGSEDMEASRRVEFKFTLKDAEMIAEMNRILTMNDNASVGE
ncbi:MAG: OmpA family protein [Clostridia bacterium]|nr:OmpA family protein [Clostridia bacterium]